MTNNKMWTAMCCSQDRTRVMRGIIAFVFLFGVTINTSGCFSQSKHSTNRNVPAVDNAGSVLAVVLAKTAEPEIPSTCGGRESVPNEETTGLRGSVGVVFDSKTDPMLIDGASGVPESGGDKTGAAPVIPVRSSTSEQSSANKISSVSDLRADPTDPPTSAKGISSGIDLKGGLGISEGSDSSTSVDTGIGLSIPVSNSEPGDDKNVSTVVQDSSLRSSEESSTVEQEALDEKRKEMKSLGGLPDIEEFEQPADTDENEPSLLLKRRQSVLEDEESAESVEGDACGDPAYLNKCYPVDMFGPVPAENEQSRALSFTTLTAHTGFVAVLFMFTEDEMVSLFPMTGSGNLFDIERYVDNMEFKDGIKSALKLVIKSFCVDSGVFDKIKNEEYIIDMRGNVVEMMENAPSNLIEWIKYIDRISENIIEIPSVLDNSLIKVCMPFPVVLDIFRERLDCMTARFIEASSSGESSPFQLNTSTLGIIRRIDPNGQNTEINEIKLNVENYFREMIQHIDGVIERLRGHIPVDENVPFNNTIRDDALALIITNDPDMTLLTANRHKLYSNLISLVTGYTDYKPNNAYRLFHNELLRWRAAHLQEFTNYDTYMLMAYAVTEFVRDEIMRIPGRDYENDNAANVIVPTDYFTQAPTRNQLVGIFNKFKDGIQKLVDGTLPVVTDYPLETLIGKGDMQEAARMLTAFYNSV